jgi:hypothetical protein
VAICKRNCYRLQNFLDVSLCSHGALDDYQRRSTSVTHKAPNHNSKLRHSPRRLPTLCRPSLCPNKIWIHQKRQSCSFRCPSVLVSGTNLVVAVCVLLLKAGPNVDGTTYGSHVYRPTLNIKPLISCSTCIIVTVS